MVLFYKFNRIIAYPARALVYSSIIYWYYTERKRDNALNLTDKLFIWSCILPIFSPLADYIWPSVPTKILEIILLMASNQLIASIWIEEGAKINFSVNQKNTFIKVLVPYIILPVLFFCFVVLPTNQVIPIVLFTFYLLQMMYITTLSAFVPFPEKSKLYVSLAMGILVLSSGANFLRICVSPYEYDFAVVRFTAVAFRVFLAMSLLHRETHEVESPYLR
ncbi:hypothetical protein GCM10027442_02180 [Emticicia fontis]